MAAARGTVATGGKRGEHDMVTDGEVGDPDADGLDNSGGLVAENGRHRIAALLHGHVAVADPTVGHPH